MWDDNIKIKDGNLNIKELVYIKASDVYCELYTIDGEKKIMRKTLTNFEDELKKYGFIRVHKSYLVNMNFIKKIDKDFIDLGIAKVRVAVRKRKKVKEKYKEYCVINGRI